MKYVAIFHANLNYAYLTPDRYEFVIRSSYELILDTMRERFPNVKFVFEASGYTIDQIAEKTPDVLKKLRAAIASGQCEFMGSPYAHPMLPNFPEEDGTRAIAFANAAYRRQLGRVPRSFWNPECGWRSFIPRQVRANGYRNLIGDFEAYSRSCGPDGKPLRPEIYALEHSDAQAFYHFGFRYDLPGDEPAIHFPFTRFADGQPGKGLRVFLRTDRVAQFGVRFFMGMQGYTLKKYLDLVRRYSAQRAGEPEGALIVFADDAEYVGTNGWFRLKYQNRPDNVFEATPRSRENLIAFIEGCLAMGSFITFDEACNLPPLDEPIGFDDDSAWHGARASTWAGTPMAQLLRPWQDLVRARLHRVASRLPAPVLERAWLYLTNSYNSDGQWPPTLPESPHLVHPFNYGYCFENLLAAELMVGGVDRSRLSTDPVKTLQTIMGPQQRLVLAKAKRLANAAGSGKQKAAAQQALELVRRSQDVASLRRTGGPLLYPHEYGLRADLLVEARRLVGGVEIEKI